MRLKKRKKYSRIRGRRTVGYSAKLNKGKGSRGGKGMSGSGKRADQKKTKITKEYGGKYFGKKGETSKKTARKKVKIISLETIMNKFKPGNIDLKKFKILGNGEIKGKFIITCKACSKSAKEKIESQGGKVIIEEKKITGKPTEKKLEDKKEEIK